MSGKAKKNIFIGIEIVLMLAVAAATAAMFYSVLVFFSERNQSSMSFLFAGLAAVVSYTVLSVNTLVHESGHLLFGALAGMKFASVQVSFFRLERRGGKWKFGVAARNAAGASEMYPARPKSIEKKMIAFSLGGAVCNLIYGAVFLTLFFVVPYHPALLFFELFAPLNLLDAFSALYPIELPAGKTDGAVVRGLVKKEPAAVAALNVLTAQGILNNGTFSDIPEELLFDVPAVREDDTAFISLTQMRFHYLLYIGNDEAAAKELARLDELFCYLPDQAVGEIACDLVYGYSVIAPDSERAEFYLPEAEKASGTCAYFRAMTANGVKECRKSALAAAERESIRGIAELEKKLIAKIKEEDK